MSSRTSSSWAPSSAERQGHVQPMAAHGSPQQPTEAHHSPPQPTAAHRSPGSQAHGASFSLKPEAESMVRSVGWWEGSIPSPPRPVPGCPTSPRTFENLREDVSRHVLAPLQGLAAALHPILPHLAQQADALSDLPELLSLPWHELKESPSSRLPLMSPGPSPDPTRKSIQQRAGENVRKF